VYIGVACHGLNVRMSYINYFRSLEKTCNVRPLVAMRANFAPPPQACVGQILLIIK
jgi:hypothetical protein